MATKVASFSELKSAVEDAVTTEIIVTENITFSSGGIKVNVAKSSLVIDFDSHTVTDNNSQTFTEAIYVPSTTNSLSVTIKNAVWSGRNYYGVLGVYDNNTNVSITLENISYKGPQFVYNKYGTTNIINCTVVLDQNGSSASTQEFCEANRLNISGITEVTSNSASNAVIWFTGTGASLSVRENSTFTVTALSTYFLYTDVSPVMTFANGSKTTITTKGGLFYSTGSSSHIASSFTLEENASFVAYQKQTGSAPMFKCLSNFTAGKNSTFELFKEASSSTALCYFGQVANIKFSLPKSVILYNNGGNVFSFQTGSASNPNVINISSQQLRVWSSATTPLSNVGGINDLPTNEFYRADYEENLSLNVKITNSQVQSVESDLTESDVGYPLNASTLNLLASKVIAFGEILLSVNAITDLSTEISGLSNLQANIQAEFNLTTHSGTADSDGNFILPLSEKIPVDSEVKMIANKNFLTKTLTFLSEGSLSISIPNALKFYTFVSPTKLNVIYRQNSDFSVQVLDTRTSGQQWFLYAYVLNPLTNGTETLDDAIFFRQNENDTILTKNPYLVFTGKWEEANKTTTVQWESLEGFLLGIQPDKEYAGGNYQTELLWQISTTKLE